MLKFSVLAAVAATTLMAGGVVAKDKKADTAGVVKEKKICKGHATSYSRIPQKKVCRTQAEWDAMGGQGGLDEAEGKLRGISRGN
jgi:hypothetical protein